MTTQFSPSQAAHIDDYGFAVSRRLSEGLDTLPHDITERLRAARTRAIASRQPEPVKLWETAEEIEISGGVAGLHQGGSDGFNSWWRKVGAVLPLLALVAGLFVIGVIQDENRVREAAEVDAELLTDELPLSAYVDPGFAQFVRNQQSH